MARNRSKRPQTLLDLSDRRLIAMAGERSFERGRTYAAEGRVEIETCEPQAVTATVSGTEDYSVGLEFADGELECGCDCLAFEDQGFCKHLVATVLVAREQLQAGRHSKRAGSQAAPAGKDAPPLDLDRFLRAQPAEQLATWLMELSDTHPEIRERLRLHQSRGDAGALRRQLGSLLRRRDFLDWRESTDFARRLDGAIDSIAEVVEADADTGQRIVRVRNYPPAADL